MTSLHASICQCANCPGASCGCGCRHTPVAAATIDPAACTCQAACGCDAAESGCQCGMRTVD